MEQATTFGDRLRMIRKRSGVSATSLASSVGITENAVRKLESGSSGEPRFMTGIRMARALGVSPLVLAGDCADTAGAPSLAFVIHSIRAIRDELHAQGIEHIDIFGSVARGDATPESDVDLIFTPKLDARFDLFNLSWSADQIEAALGRKADVITRRTAEQSHRLLGVLEDAVRVF